MPTLQVGVFEAVNDYINNTWVGTEILRADPVIRIVAEHVAAIAEGDSSWPFAQLIPRPGELCGTCPGVDNPDRPMCFVSGRHEWGWGMHPLLRFEGLNRTVVYRLTHYNFLTECYTAEWPD